MRLSTDLELVADEPIKTAILESRMSEMIAHEELVKGLRQLNLAARAMKLFCEDELEYTELETRNVLGELGLIITTDALTSPDPVVRLKIEKLKTWRRERSRADRIAAYRVISNRTLLSVASQKIETSDELKKIAGFGPKKIENFGREILALLNVP